MAINLGNVVGNQTVGISSGIDSKALIEGLSVAKQKPIDALNTKIDLNTSKITEYGKVSSLLTNLKAKANYFRNPVGILSNYSNIFEYRTSSVTSATLTPSSYASITANPGAQKGTFDLEVSSVAQALEQRSASFSSRATSATTSATGSYFNTGTFQIGSGKVVSVTGALDSTPALVAADYTVEGSATGILTSAGITNIVITGASGGQTGPSRKYRNFCCYL